MSLLKGFEHLSWSALREDLGLHDGPLDTDDGASAASPHPTDHDPFALGLSVLEPAVVVSCNKCRKSILQTAFVEHLNYCSGLPEAAAALPSDSQRISNPQPPKKRKKEPSASTPIADSPAVIPITIEDAAPKLEKPAKIAKTNQLKAKVAGQPLDLDRQCGVMSDKTGLPCARSITCKIHPVNQKRAVQGRSQTYDALILELQRKKPGDTRAGTPRTTGTIAGAPAPTVDIVLTKDQEADMVFEAIRFNHPRPCVQPPQCAAVESLFTLSYRRSLESALTGAEKV